MLSIAFLIAQAADAVTFAMLPPGAERNPIFADPRDIGLAIVAKVAVVVLVAGVAFLARYRRPRIAAPLLMAGALIGAFGAGSNVSVLL